MQVYSNICTTLIISLALVSCSPKPMFSNLHKGPYSYDTAPEDILTVTAGILPITKMETEVEKPRMPWDLRDSLPHILVKTLGVKERPDTIMKIMAMQIPPISEKKEAPKLAIDYTQYKVLITFSNIKRYFVDSRFMHPNTRLEFLNMKLSLPASSNFSFYNLDKLVNEYEEIDLGSLERNQSITFNAKLSGTGDLGTSLENSNGQNFQNDMEKTYSKEIPVYDGKGNQVGTISSGNTNTSTNSSNNASKVSNNAKATAAAEGSYQNVASIKEALNVKLKRMKTGFSFSDKDILISQRGRPGGDISDNVYITATLKFTATNSVDSKNVYYFNNTYDDNQQPRPADALVFSMRNVSYIPCVAGNAADLSITYEGAIRAVGNDKRKTGENSLEYDDQVTYYKIPKSTCTGIKINENVFCKKVYKITALDDQNKKCDLRIVAPTDAELDLFSDDNPAYFLQWVLHAVGNGDAKFLTSKKLKIYFEEPATHRRIYLVKDNFTASELTDLKKLHDIKTELR